MSEYSADEEAAVGIIEVARIAHEVNRAYCEALGDTSQLPWDDAPDWQKESAWKGVMAIVNDPSRGPEASHVSWLKDKEEAGWIWGPTKNPELGTHPCMVPFEELPPNQKVKDHLFVGTVKALLQIPAGS